ncbi:L,D-transpeptidase [Nocardioides sp. MAHUQ-72]|uniref:L,D-transpeptidase n=1 Tax=unclassified Nocardioides TaxID=2615069 RepID=UPI003620906D
MSRHREHSVRPRYGRIAVLGSSVTVTAVAVLGGSGMLPSAASTPEHRGRAAIEQVSADRPATASERAATGAGSPDRVAGQDDVAPVTSQGSADASEYRARDTLDIALPVRSGTGRRVVFSEGRQRVWLVGAHDRVLRTYLVSGSVTDNLSQGTYEVYSRSEQAWGIDDSGTMKYFVRFTHGDRAAIGFHDIPVDDGRPVQSVAQLGTPQSHGCIRQRRGDALALWEFAPVGTTVVVV